MTLVGKIFTVLIFVMSICFMTASVMVFATHKNWKESSQETGKKLTDLKLVEASLKEELERYKKTLEMERASRRAVLGSLNARLTKSEGELAAKQREYDAMIADLTKVSEEYKVTQSRLVTLETEIGENRKTLRDTQADLDDKFGQVVRLTDDLNQAAGLKVRLDERNTQLALQVTRMKLVMDAHGLDERTLVSHIEPTVWGKVLAVNASNLVEVSIGSDDGLKAGHKMQVYRGNQFLGEIIIRRTSPDRSVGEINPNIQRGKIQKGDNVTTKLT